MSKVEELHPDGTDFDRFLYAFVGEDRNGSDVTVVSVFARLGLDPWKEAADLAVLGKEGSRTRLSGLLSGFKDVPTLGGEHAAVAARLIMLLPERLSRRAPKRSVPIQSKGPLPSKGSMLSIELVFGVIVVVLVLARIYALANPG